MARQKKLLYSHAKKKKKLTITNTLTILINKIVIVVINFDIFYFRITLKKNSFESRKKFFYFTLKSKLKIYEKINCSRLVNPDIKIMIIFVSCIY